MGIYVVFHRYRGKQFDGQEPFISVIDGICSDLLRMLGDF